MDLSGLSESELLALVFKDELTGLYNRRYFNSYLSKLDIENGARLTLAMIDVDLFKAVNDRCGHAAGDATLRRIGELLSKHAGPDDLPIRYAGDEFAVIFPGASSAEAMERAEAMRKAVETDAFEDARLHDGIRPSLSIGLAEFPRNARDQRELFERADRALYASKRTRNRVTGFDDIRDDSNLAIREALANFPARELVGRPETWISAAGAVDAVLSGATRFSLVVAPPGMGKSRFLSEVRNLTSAAGMLMLQHSCAFADQFCPYEVISAVLDRTFRHDSKLLNDVQKALRPRQWLLIQETLPNFSVHGDPRRGNSDIVPRSPTVELAEAFQSCLEILATDKPLAFLLDDIQFADEGTLDVLLRYLRRSHKPALFYGAYSEALAPSLAEGLSPWWASFRSALDGEIERVQVLRLSALSCEEVSGLIDALLPGFQRAEAFDRTLWELSSGNPLFIENGLRGLIQERQLRRESDQWLLAEGALEMVPKTLEELISSQLGRLDSETRNLVSGVSVVGHAVSFEDIKTLTQARSDGEVLDIIEKARRANLIVDSKDPHAPGFEFASGSYRTRSYKSLDSRKRQTTHAAVARLAERHGRHRPPRAAGKVAFHYRESDQPEKARRFEQLLGQYRARLFDREELDSYDEEAEAPVPECREPLSDEAVRRIPELLKAFAAAARNLRMYPAGSRVRSESATRLRQSLNRLGAEAKVISFSHRGPSLAINGRVIEALNPKAAQGFVQLLRANSLKTMTIITDISDSELDLILEELSRRTAPTPLERDHWRRFTRTNKLNHSALIQKAFVLRHRDSSTNKLRPLQKRELKEADLEALRHICRFFMAALEHVSLYPSGSPFVTESIKGLQEHVSAFLNEHEALILSPFEDSLLVNGNPVPQRALGSGGIDLARLLLQPAVKGLAILRGATSLELELLVNRLAALRRTGARRATVVEQADFKHIVLGEDMFRMAESVWGYRPRSSAPPQLEARKLPSPEAPITASTPSPPTPTQRADLSSPWPADRIAQEARDLTLRPGAEILRDPQLRERLLKVFESLLLERRVDIARRLMEHCVRPLIVGNAADRQNAARFFTDFLEKAPRSSSRPLARIATSRVADALERETDLAVYTPLAQFSQEVVLRELEAGDIETAARLTWALGRRRDQVAADDPELRKMARQTCEAILADTRFRIVKERLLYAPAEVARHASHLLEGLGRAAMRWVLALLSAQDFSVEVETRLIELLVPLRPHSAEALRVELTPFESPSRTRRLLRAAPRLIEDPQELLTSALANTDPTVRLVAVQVATELPAAKAVQVLTHAVASPSTATELIVVPALARLGRPEASDTLVKILQRSAEIEVQRECALALGKLRVESSIPALEKVLVEGFLTRSYHDDVRTAAAWALSQFKRNPEVRKILERLRDDRCERVALNARNYFEARTTKSLGEGA